MATTRLKTLWSRLWAWTGSSTLVLASVGGNNRATGEWEQGGWGGPRKVSDHWPAGSAAILLAANVVYMVGGAMLLCSRPKTGTRCELPEHIPNVMKTKQGRERDGSWERQSWAMRRKAGRLRCRAEAVVKKRREREGT